MQVRTPEVELAEKMHDFLYALNLKLIEMAEADKTIMFSDIKKAVNKSYVNNPDTDTSAKKSKSRKSKLSPITTDTDNEEITRQLEEIAKLIPPGLDIDVKGNNNLNLIIHDPITSTSIVIQFSKKRNMPYVVSGEKDVSARLHGQPIDAVLSFHSNAMAKDYAKPLYVPIDAVQPPKKSFNNDNNEKMISIRSTEYLPTSISKAIKDMQPNERLALAMNITKQVSALLTTLYQNNILWTDLKEGNIMLKDNNIVIADTKGFIFSDKINLTFIEKSNSFRGMFEATGALCSSSYDKLSLISASAALSGLTPEERKAKLPEIANDARKTMTAEWPKEHNYQMAVLIYFILTGKNVYTPDNPKDKFKELDDGYNYFKFDTPAFDFTSPAGKEMRKIIEQLSNDNPDLRMSHQDAVTAFKKSPELGAVLKEDMVKRSASLKQEENERKKNLEEAAALAASRQHVLPRSISTRSVSISQKTIEQSQHAAPGAPDLQKGKSKPSLLRRLSKSNVKKDIITPSHTTHHDTTIIHDPTHIHSAPVKQNTPEKTDKKSDEPTPKSRVPKS